jgi:hypothetical protein
MNNLFLVDSGQAPQPREHVKITELSAKPYPDGSRVRIQLNLTPFSERPNLEIHAHKVDGPLVAEMSVIQTMTPVLELTLHIRGVEELIGDYILRAELYYDDRACPQHTREIAFQIATET